MCDKEYVVIEDYNDKTEVITIDTRSETVTIEKGKSYLFKARPVMVYSRSYKRKGRRIRDYFTIKGYNWKNYKSRKID
jgi:hypothetical protein